MPRMNRELLNMLLDWKAWDRWLPLGTVALFLVIGLVVLAFGITFGIPSNDLERFHIIYTEIGVQTTAGIFAIIVSLSLVAIQFAAQEYSHRIMEYYIRSTVFWTTLIAYLGVMSASIFLQVAADETESPVMGALVIVGSMLAFALLIPHFLITAAYLKPEFVVGKLIKRIDQHYLRAFDRRGLPKPSADRLLPIIEIVERAIDRGDLTTTRGALEQVRASYESAGLPVESALVDRYYLDGLLRAGRKAISQADEQQAAVLALDVIGWLGMHRSPAAAVDALEELGFGALRQDAEVAVSEMIDAISEVAAASNDTDLRSTAMATYAELVDRLVGANQRRLLQKLTFHVSAVALSAFEAGAGGESRQAVKLLENIGHDTAVAHIGQVVTDVSRALQELGVTFAKTDPEAARAIVLALLRVERAVDRTERDIIAALEFGRAEIEQSIGPARDAPSTSAVPVASDGADEDFSGLWSEPED